MAVLYGAALSLLFAAPAIVCFSPTTYPLLSTARLLSFLLSLVIYVAYGRLLRRRNLPRLYRGLYLGAASAFLGTLLYQYLIRLPAAEASLIQILPGVPTSATITMLHLHQRTGALLSAIVSAGLNGLFGGIATWWAGRRPRTSSAPEPEQGSGENRASGF